MSTLARALHDWPVGSAAAVVVSADATLDRCGPPTPYAWASITKLLTALTVLSLAETGVVDLDETAGPPGATVAHLLAHASGLSLRGGAAPVAAPGQRRVYSNAGYELLAQVVERRTGEPFGESVARHVLDPLALEATMGTAASGAAGSIDALAVVARELLAPRGLPARVVTQLATPAFPGLPGELPGFGWQEHNEWGLGAEVRGHKHPHWTSPFNSARTFGHFGQAGGFLWVDPDAGLACASLSDRAFGQWSADRWPRLATHVLRQYGSTVRE